MYVPTRNLPPEVRVPGAGPRPTPPTRHGGGARGPAGVRVARNVVLLGLTSMMTDIAAEMVISVLPLYLTARYGFSPAQLGAFDGVYRGMTAVVVVLAAVLSDRRRRHKAVAAIGYTLSTGCWLGLLVTGGAWGPTMGLLYLDRLGKGMRTAPRDALISLSSAPAGMARSFGVHRALDTAGAVAGPLAAALLLARDPEGFRGVFVVAVAMAIVGLAILLLFVDGRPRPPTDALGTDEGADDGGDGTPEAATAREAMETATTPSPPGTWRAVAGLLADPHVRRVALAGLVLAAAVPGDALLYLAFQRKAELAIGLFPLLFVGASVVFLLTAIPVGRLADRVGRASVLLAGHALLIGAYAIVASDARGTAALVLLLVLVGVHYAATEGVLLAMASTVIPAHVRSTGLGLVTMAIVVGHAAASIAFGALWSISGAAVATRTFAVALVPAIVVGAVLLGPRRPRVGAA